MSDLGGADIKPLKKGINSIFLKDDKILVTSYEIKLVSYTTD